MAKPRKSLQSTLRLHLLASDTSFLRDGDAQLGDPRTPGILPPKLGKGSLPNREPQRGTKGKTKIPAVVSP